MLNIRIPFMAYFIEKSIIKKQKLNIYNPPFISGLISIIR